MHLKEDVTHNLLCPYPVVQFLIFLLSRLLRRRSIILNIVLCQQCYFLFLLWECKYKIVLLHSIPCLKKLWGTHYHYQFLYSAFLFLFVLVCSCLLLSVFFRCRYNIFFLLKWLQFRTNKIYLFILMSFQNFSIISLDYVQFFLLPLKKFSLTWNSENILWPLICINFLIL